LIAEFAALAPLKPELNRVFQALAFGDFSQHISAYNAEGTSWSGETADFVRTFNALIAQIEHLSTAAEAQPLANEIQQLRGHIQHLAKLSTNPVITNGHHDSHLTPDQVFDTEEIDPQLKGT
jgi:hypothetical protein